MNNVKMSGRLTHEPKLKHINKKRAVCEMRLAVDNGRHPTTYIDLSVFDAPAYGAAEHLSKGCRVKVEGELRFREWKDTAGWRHQRYSIVGRVEQLGRQPERKAEAVNQADSQTAGATEPAPSLA
jgi:single stranded DNA-binding protein